MAFSKEVKVFFQQGNRFHDLKDGSLIAKLHPPKHIKGRHVAQWARAYFNELYPEWIEAQEKQYEQG